MSWVSRFTFLKKLLGLNFGLPRTYDVEVEDRWHGMTARNVRGQAVVWDENQQRWVMPQNLSTKVAVEIK